MGRRSKYTTVKAKKKAQAIHNKQVKLDPEIYGTKKRREQEYQKKRREQEKLPKHPNPLAHLLDPVTQERLLEELNNEEVSARPIARVEPYKVMERYVFWDENLFEEFPGGFSNGHESGMKTMAINLIIR